MGVGVGMTRQRLKTIIGGSAGNLVEWYDWFAYATFSIYFAPLFFPEGDLTAQLLNTAAIFAAGFLMRPIGAWVMGIYGPESDCCLSGSSGSVSHSGFSGVFYAEQILKRGHQEMC